ncbi:hypothetical protein BDN71DRAFT_1457913 [Pleurotus eryngii]|uniref:Uncharacterized protein n=1 Tax=Pleurotus eryngii TaxID=5323 RepID=A0A9P5ZHN9_PLEER|nr:hypothetical protein BDN71DRAFT_1457913 [Pleurotus eryngii]
MHFSSDIQPLGHATTSEPLLCSPDSLSSLTNTSSSTVASRKSSSSSGYGFLPLFPLPPLPPLVTSTSISPPSSADEWEISPLVPSKPFDAKKTLRMICYIVTPEPLKEIRGWTDDSNSWTATVYGLVDTDPSDSAARPEMEEVYRKHNACAHRSKGVYSTIGTKDISSIPTPAPSLRRAHSWSYDNVPMYQPMKMPPSIKKRKVKQIVDGVEKEVTIQVQVENNGKCLFNFPDKEYYARR